ncbi:MAG: SRPBCC family protein [Conexibacter sp.]
MAAPLQQTWAALLDVERVASCLPGATIEPVGEDGAYRGQMKMRIGPVSVQYGGTVRLAEVDEDSHVTVFRAQAKETKGTGTATATIRNELSEQDGETRVVVATTLDITGRPAQFGRGMMQDVAGRMLDDFAARLQQLVLDTAAGVTRAETDDAGSPAALPEDEAATLDLGGMVWRNYRRELGVAGVLVAVLVALGLLRARGRRGPSIELKVRARA